MTFSRQFKFRLFTILIFFIVLFSFNGNVYSKIIAEQDSIIKMYGYIYDTISQSPAKIPLYAKLIIASLPHGSEVGIITTNDSTGYYEYYININKNYRVNIRSDKHKLYYHNIDPAQLAVNREVKCDYYLRPEVKKNQVIRLNKLIFELGKSYITPESFGELNQLVILLEQRPQMQIQLEGHTDYRGGRRTNMVLSQERVDAVKNYLVEKGINTRRIKTKAYGGTRPIIKEETLEASELNRRVEVRILRIE